MRYARFKPAWDGRRRSPLETGVVPTRPCDVPGCAQAGDYRAPKSRDTLRDYHWFCLEHVRQYNQQWDFFKGMSRDDIEGVLRRSVLGDRPTWRATRAGLREAEAALRDRIHRRFAEGDGVFSAFSAEDDDGDDLRIPAAALPHPAAEALAVLGLKPPVVWEEIRARYKTLVKRHHPDLHGNSRAAEETLKKINLAYSILKLAAADLPARNTTP